MQIVQITGKYSTKSNHPHIGNHKEYLDWLGNKLGYKQYEDWYQISAKNFYNNGGSTALNKHKGCLTKLIASVYSEHQWIPWKFSGGVPKKYWNDIKNQRKYLDWLGNKLGYKQYEDWYQISTKTIHSNGGVGLMKKYNDSPPSLISTVYNEFKWILWKFEGGVPKGFWDDIQNQRKYLDWLGNKLGYKQYEDWYQISKKTIDNNGGVGVLHGKYNSSPILLITTVYNEHQWMPWRFEGGVPKRYWNNQENVKRFFDRIKQTYKIENDEDWNKITTSDIIQKFEGRGLLRAYGGLESALEFAYSKKFSLKKYSIVEDQIRKYLIQLQLANDLITFHKHQSLRHSTGKPLELDFFYPSLNLAIEYQGEQHYYSMHTGDVYRQQQRDGDKRMICEQNGIILVEIPYYEWDGSIETLKQKILKKLPSITFKGISN